MNDKTLPVIKTIESNLPPKEGSSYLFIRTDRSIDNGITIHEGECVRCDRCHKAAIANSVQVTSFGHNVTHVSVSGILKNAQELSYDEETELCLCETCINTTTDKFAHEKNLRLQLIELYAEQVGTMTKDEENYLTHTINYLYRLINKK